MLTTSASLLMRLKDVGEPAAWSRFVRLYSPMIYEWSRRIGLQDADALDLVQDVFTSLVQKLPEFSYEADRGFRGWLWIVTRNKFLERARRSKLPIDKSIYPDRIESRSDLKVREEDFRCDLLDQLVPAMRGQFQPATWKAFWEFVVEGRPVADVAKELNVGVDAVYKAKTRVLSRLHAELADLVTE